MELVPRSTPYEFIVHLTKDLEALICPDICSAASSVSNSACRDDARRLAVSHTFAGDFLLFMPPPAAGLSLSLPRATSPPIGRPFGLRELTACAPAAISFAFVDRRRDVRSTGTEFGRNGFIYLIN